VAECFRGKAKSRDEWARLSPREKELLALLSKGHSNKEIADKLALSVEAIHRYLKNVHEKSAIHGRICMG
jgi:DNA-binding CsgD family transcriptional regulator